MITRAYDDANGIIRVTSSGYWTAGDVADHFAKLRTLIAALRDLDRPIRLLSDVTKAPRQPSITEQLILAEMAKTFQAGDRVAILAANLGDKSHARALLGAADIAVFALRENAETWLMLSGAGEAVA